jgi:hypothetical protein
LEGWAHAFRTANTSRILVVGWRSERVVGLWLRRLIPPVAVVVAVRVLTPTLTPVLAWSAHRRENLSRSAESDRYRRLAIANGRDAIADPVAGRATSACSYAGLGRMMTWPSL